MTKIEFFCPIRNLTMLTQETLATITIFTPSLPMFRRVQLSHRRFHVTPAQQFAVRCRWRRQLNRTFRHDGCRSMLPSGRWDGPWCDVYPTGLVQACGYYMNGKQHGIHQTWHKNGRQWSRGTCIHGKIHGEYMIWYSSGHMCNQSTYVNGKLHGPVMEWHESGQLREQYECVNGARHGKYISWTQTGHLWYRGEYINNGLHLEHVAWR